MKQIIFWQDSINSLQSSFLESMGGLCPQITVVGEKELRERRKRLGWSKPSVGNCEVIELPTKSKRKNLIKASGVSSFHIVSGFHAYRETFWTLKKLIKSKRSVGVFVEPVRDEGLIGIVKRRYYEFHSLRFSAALKFLLVTGQSAFNWYRDRGFPEKIVFPFGYFPGVSFNEHSRRKSQDCNFQSFQIGFVGQLCQRKGMIDLLHAVRELSASAWQCHIIGSGDLEDFCKNFELLPDSMAKVHLHGAVPYQEVGGFLAEFDLLVLPSHFDGWGAVVNEALQCGTPVLVSDACGSCDLVRTLEVGRIFRAGSVEDLRDKLEAFLHEGKVSRERRARIREWASKTISPEAGASYLLEILEYTSGQREERPVAPWHKERVL